MSAKIVFVLCIQAIISQVAFGQCGCGSPYLGAAAAPALPLSPSCASGISSGLQIVPTSGGLFLVTSSSAIAPSGISVASENVFEGSLNVVGELPFISAVALEGAFPSAGAGVVSYSCGNGVTAITSQGNNLGAAAIPAIGSYAPASAPAVAPAYGLTGFGGCGCGY